MNDVLLVIAAVVFLPIFVLFAAAIGTGSINLLRESSEAKKGVFERIALVVCGVVGLLAVVGFAVTPIFTHGVKGAAALLLAVIIWWFLVRPHKARSEDTSKDA